MVIFVPERIFPVIFTLDRALRLGNRALIQLHRALKDVYRAPRV